MKRTIAVLLLIAGLTYSGNAADALYSIDTDNTGFGGGIDFVSIDKVGSKFSPIGGILNVNTDRYNEITKRNGSIAYNATPTPGALKHRRGYVYNQADGDSYIVINTSKSIVATKGDGTFTTVISTLTDAAESDFTTAEDCLYFTNGIDAPGKWDGTSLTNYTIANSTYYPQNCKYIANFRSRNWMAGDSVYRNRVYYTQAYAPGLTDNAYRTYADSNLNPLFIDLGTGDGDYITGIQVWNGRLLIYFKYKIFEIYEYSTGEFAYNMLSSNIGCLYSTTLDVLNGFPIFVSHRGIEQFDGSQLVTKSMPTDYYVKGLRQLVFEQGEIVLDSAEDWGAGTGVNVDTTTSPGYVVLRSSVTGVIVIGNEGGVNVSQAYNSKKYWRQAFYTSVTSSINYTFCNIYRRNNYPGSSAYRPDAVGIYDSGMVLLSSAPVISDGVGDGGAIMPSITLTANTTYYIMYTMKSVGLTTELNYITCGAEASTNKTKFMEYSLNGTGWGFADGSYLNTYMDFEIAYFTYYNNGSYVMPIKEATSWGSWGVFSAQEIVPEGSDISYYVVTSTSIYNINTNPAHRILNNTPINSTVGPYIKIVSTMTKSTESSIPKFSSFRVGYYGNDNNVPTGKAWNDRYYLSVNTGTVSSRNDMTLVLQKNGDFTRYSIGAGCFVVYRDKLYYGDALDTGYLFQMEVSNLYTDNGKVYESYWTSKKIAYNPIYKNTTKEFWLTAAGIAGTLDLSYNFDDYDGAWIDKSIAITATRKISVSKVHITPSCYAQLFQFKIGNSSAVDFRIKRIDLLYDDVPCAE